MPTAQSSSSSSTQGKQNKGAKSVNASNSNFDNKIAKAAAKVAESCTARVSSQDNTRATTPDQQQNALASNQGGNKTPQEQPEFIKQALIIIEKKVRNLEKRRIKLEEYRATQAKGETLNDDQLLAVSRYDEVIRTLELSRDLEKQFIQLANDAMKQQKKQIKKEQTEREEAIKEKLKESNKIITLLNTFTHESVRNDFLNETNGASKLNEHEIVALEQFRNLVLPTNQINKQLDLTSSESAEHVFNLIEGKNKQIGQLNAQVVGAAFTYADLKKLIDRVICSPYWKKREESNYDSPQIDVVSKIEETVSNSEADKMVDASNINDQLNQLNIDDQSRIQQNCNEINSNNTVDQAVYHQQNTSEDYILVSSTEYSGENSQNKNTSKTFFSTLNPQDSVNRNNINEFLNRCENSDDCINFLQDSEIQQHEMQHQNLQQQENEHTNQQQESDHYQTYDPRTQSQNLTNYQDFPTNQELNKDNRGYRQQREYNNGPRNNNNQSNQFQQRPRYQDDQRGPRRSGGGSIGQNNGQINSQTRNGGGNPAGYKGNRGLGGSGNNRGEYRGSGGSSNYQTGSRQSGGGGGAGNGGGQRFPPRVSENRQQVI